MTSAFSWQNSISLCPASFKGPINLRLVIIHNVKESTGSEIPFSKMLKSPVSLSIRQKALNYISMYSFLLSTLPIPSQT